jgi:hypothetical protein
VANEELWKALIKAAAPHTGVEWSWVKAQSGLLLNECADTLATRGVFKGKPKVVADEFQWHMFVASDLCFTMKVAPLIPSVKGACDPPDQVTEEDQAKRRVAPFNPSVKGSCDPSLGEAPLLPLHVPQLRFYGSRPRLGRTSGVNRASERTYRKGKSQGTSLGNQHAPLNLNMPH